LIVFLNTTIAAGHLDLTNKLLDRGGDPNLLNGLGQSMIAGAVFKGHDDVVRALAARGADPRLGQPTAIQTAQMFKKTELMSVLGATEGDTGSEVPPAVPSGGSG
jgi:ankyrin repeat protein